MKIEQNYEAKIRPCGEDSEVVPARPVIDWRRDLEVFRGLSERDRRGFLLLLEWFENFRLRMGLEPGREAAVQFWKAEVKGKGEREDWKLDQWSAALSWYLKWLSAGEEKGAEVRSLPERLRGEYVRAAVRRGHSLRTRQCYGLWVTRFGRFAGSEEAVHSVQTASRFLASVVADEEVAYATQKQALNALAFFFKAVLGQEQPRFDIKLRRTGPRVPTVLSQEEVVQVINLLPNRYRLAARLQYGSGLRLSELLRLRVKDIDLKRRTLTVRKGKGDKDRVTVLPKVLLQDL